MPIPKKRLIAINGNAGAFIDIFCTIPCRYVEIREDDAAPAVGLQYKTIEDGFANTYVAASGNEPVIIGQKLGLHPTRGASYIGVPAGYAAPGTAATRLASVLSKTAAATNVWITEYQ